jgi:hypothetical protein
VSGVCGLQEGSPSKELDLRVAEVRLMTLYQLEAKCDACGELHPLDVTIDLEHGPSERMSVMDAFRLSRSTDPGRACWFGETATAALSGERAANRAALALPHLHHAAVVHLRPGLDDGPHRNR